MSLHRVTAPQKSALLWLRNRNGTGTFDAGKVLIAAEERAPYRYGLFMGLRELGLVRFTRQGIEVTSRGNELDLSGVREA